MGLSIGGYNPNVKKQEFREYGLEPLDGALRKRLYPNYKKYLTLEDVLINYTWEQLFAGKASYEDKGTGEKYREYEDNLPPGCISLREYIFDENSYFERQRRYYKDSSKILLDLL